MLSFDASALYDVASRLNAGAARMKLRLENPKNTKKLLSDNDMKAGRNGLQTLAKALDSLGLRVTLMAARDLLAEMDVVKDKNITIERFAEASGHIDSRLKDELSLIKVFALEATVEKYFEPSEPHFGVEVEAKFPPMSEDISEAGKCLALSRPTAAVFHLMRVMEIGVQRLGDELGIKLTEEKNWQTILDGTNKAIKALDHKLVRTKKLAEVSSHLYAVSRGAMR